MPARIAVSKLQNRQIIWHYQWRRKMSAQNPEFKTHQLETKINQPRNQKLKTNKQGIQNSTYQSERKRSTPKKCGEKNWLNFTAGVELPWCWLNSEFRIRNWVGWVKGIFPIPILSPMNDEWKRSKSLQVSLTHTHILCVFSFSFFFLGALISSSLYFVGTH